MMMIHDHHDDDTSFLTPFNLHDISFNENSEILYLQYVHRIATTTTTEVVVEVVVKVVVLMIIMVR